MLYPIFHDLQDIQVFCKYGEKLKMTELTEQTDIDDLPSFGSVFTGVGGFDLGIERAGWKAAWQIENDLYCNRVMKGMFPDDWTKGGKDAPRYRTLGDWHRHGVAQWIAGRILNLHRQGN